MGRLPRYLPDGALVGVTMRCVQGRRLLRPSAELNDLVAGVFGRAQHLYGMPIVALSVLGNHLHLGLVPEDAEQLARFQCHVATNLSKEVGRLHDWPGPMWERRYRAIPVTDEEFAQVRALRYWLGQGTAENLVSRVRQWPGIHCARALADAEAIRGRWFDRSAEYRARLLGKPFLPDDFATLYQIRFSPLPCWRHLDPLEYRARVANLVDQIDQNAAERRRREGRTARGKLFVLNQAPHHRPGFTKRSPAPLIHAATKAAAKLFLDGLARFLELYYDAAERQKAGEKDVTFPEGSFPPALPFVRAGPQIWKQALEAS